MTQIHDVVIIGSGPAGLTAAIYTARAGLAPVVLAGNQLGGQLMTTTDVENFPGFVEGISGPQLMQNMIKQAERFGAEVKFEHVKSVDFKSNPKTITTSSTVYAARSIIVATGASPRLLGIEGEQEFWGKGVSSCATCDGAFYKNRVVAVVGGGDSAMEEAIFLTRFASKVYIIHRKSEFRASKIMVERALSNPKIEVLWNTEVKKIIGSQTVERLYLWNNHTNSESELQVDGIFLAIGHIPNTGFLAGQLELEMEGYIKVDQHTKTNIDGVFVAGDVHDHHYRQAITAAGMGCMAALDAQKWLQNFDLNG